MVYILEIISLADFRHLGLLCAGGRPSGQEISEIFRGIMKKKPAKCRSKMVCVKGAKFVAGQRTRKCILSAGKFMPGMKKLAEELFFPLKPTVFTPFGR